MLFIYFNAQGTQFPRAVIVN